LTAVAIGAASRPLMVNIQNLFDDAKCFQTLRDMRWPDGVVCPSCGSTSVVKNGRDDSQPDRQRYTIRTQSPS
jgi:transposase-like protein